MDKEKVKHILDNCLVPDSCENTDFIETHISWVLLTDNYAFKIKRPVKYSFLDFSTPEKREYFCREELRLNRRIEPDMYLNVLPVTENLGIDDKDTSDKTIDFAVQMKRMDNSKEMDRLLVKDVVSEEQINKLAKKIASFHKEAPVIKNAFRTQESHEKFADIEKQIHFISEKLKDGSEQKVKDAVRKSFDYLNAARSYSNERVINGFIRDCHGDLNARNIFLYDDPVIFDCIEFNKDYRQIDIMNEIAFLCVDIDFFGKEDLSELFYEKYLQYSELEDDSESRKLFHYYKSYRASVRAKVTLISAQKKQEENRDYQKELKDAEKYIGLMADYLKDFKTNEKI